MRAAALFLVLAAALDAQSPDFTAWSDRPEAWSPVLESVGVTLGDAPARVRLLTGSSAEALAAGIVPTDEEVRVAWITADHDPELEIFWEEPTLVRRYSLPDQARVFARERRTETPLVAGWERGGEITLWAAAEPGERGYERFPFLVHALVDLGLQLPFRANRTHAFFDYSYRTRVDLDYFARRWRQAGIAALHVSAWHFYDSDPERDSYLHRLIAACHRQGIVVYAWLELPHVSELFWDNNPRCRERTAVLEDAKLDWRKLINLANPECASRVAAGVSGLIQRFDWDGINLAELYFESLHGPDNAQRFTPLNDWVRQDYSAKHGLDPIEFFRADSGHYWSEDPENWTVFANYRADLALRLQEKFLTLIRATLPHADVVVTQIDDRFDTRMREYLGADAGALLPLAEEYDFRLVIEDPATLWNLGPERYTQIHERYLPLTDNPGRLAIDINIVERYQDTYPTKKQIGTEFFQLVRIAGQSFPTVLLYFEHSIARADMAYLSYAAPTVAWKQRGDGLEVRSEHPFGVAWAGQAEVNGEVWPVTDGTTTWLPAGRQRVRAAEIETPLRVVGFTGTLLGATSDAGSVAVKYESPSRAIALLDRKPGRMEIDGQAYEESAAEAGSHWSVVLPRGRHEVRFHAVRGIAGLLR